MTDSSDKLIADLTATREYDVQVTVKIRTMGPSHCSGACSQFHCDGCETKCRLDNKVLSTNFGYVVRRSAYCRQLVREQSVHGREVK